MLSLILLTSGCQQRCLNNVTTPPLRWSCDVDHHHRIEADQRKKPEAGPPDFQVLPGLLISTNKLRWSYWTAATGVSQRRYTKIFSSIVAAWSSVIGWALQEKEGLNETRQYLLRGVINSEEQSGLWHFYVQEGRVSQNKEVQLHMIPKKALKERAASS